MTDTYRGESSGKRLARAAMWSLISRDSESFLTRPKVSLGGRTAGDVSTLTALGVARHNIVLAERVPEAAVAARQSNPDIRVIQGDVTSALAQAPTADAVFLDFCSYLWEETVITTIRIWEALQEDSFLAVAFMRGRERDIEFQLPRPAWRLTQKPPPAIDRNKKVKALCGRRRFHCEDTAVTSRGRMNLFEDAAKWRQKFTTYIDTQAPADRPAALRFLATEGTAQASFFIVESILKKYTPPTQFAESRGLYAYRSGVPMVICVFRKRELFKPLLGNTEKKIYFRSAGCDTEAELRSLAIQQGGGLFNLPPSTVAAWRAHNTRGTYSRTG